MGHTNLIHTGLKAHLMLCAIMADLQDLFSRKHRFPFFCKSSEDLSPLQDAVLRMLTYKRLKPFLAIAKTNALLTGSFNPDNLQKGLSEMHKLFSELGL